MSIVTIMIAFFVPVSVMIGLYVRVWWETVRRQRELRHLQGGRSNSLIESQRSLAVSSTSVAVVNAGASLPLKAMDRLGLDSSKPKRATVRNFAELRKQCRKAFRPTTSERKQDRKAAKTLSAILLAFIVTWLPYSVLTVLKGLQLEEGIPKMLWDFSYYLCYINSTVNPVLYALCNAAFRRTYLRILTCRSSPAASSRGQRRRATGWRQGRR